MKKGERFNSISHLVGAAAVTAGLVLLEIAAFKQNSVLRTVSFSIYGFTLLLLYISSTLYHSLHDRGKNFFRKLDHCSIYLLIAGTYTPFVLVSLDKTIGLTIFCLIWITAISGVIYDLIPRNGPRVIPVIIYLIMGWAGLPAIIPLKKALAFNGIILLLSGGIFYTIGVCFFAIEKKYKRAHSIWHLFVLAGSVSHYFAILLYV